MDDETPFVHQRLLLEKYPGKGGWTYAVIPVVPPNKSSHFGWVKVNGSIDGYPLTDYKLMPMGNNRLFLPVRAEIRKAIGKQAGDYVHVELYVDQAPSVQPEDFETCLRESPHASRTWTGLSPGVRKAVTDWIHAAKTDDTKVDRMAKTLEKLEEGGLPPYKS